MILSIDAEKAFDKVQHPFMIQTLNKLGLEGSYLNIIKAVYEKLIPNLLLNGENQSFSSKTRNKTGMSILTTFIQKDIKIGKEEVKLSLFADGMVYCM